MDMGGDAYLRGSDDVGYYCDHCGGNVLLLPTFIKRKVGPMEIIKELLQCPYCDKQFYLEKKLHPYIKK